MECNPNPFSLSTTCETIFHFHRITLKNDSMTKPDKPINPNRKDLSSQPHYFGAFLNIARHNAYMVMEHLSVKHDTKDKGRLDEAQLDKASLLSLLTAKNSKPDVQDAVLRDLRRYFPFLNYQFFLNEENKSQEAEKPKEERQHLPYQEVDPAHIKAVLEGFLALLNKLRNRYSHYIAQADYSKAAGLPLEKIYRSAVFRLVDKGKHTKRFDVFEPKDVAHLYGTDAAPSPFLPQNLADFPDHEKTIAFVTCLFLERKYAFTFLSRLEGFQNTTGREPSTAMTATMECYTMFCCRLPQPKLESSDIMLDMLNELGRCPSALYTVLSDEDRQKFHVKLEYLEFGENEEDADYTDTEESPQVEQEIVLKRHGDRFPYFALRYFDDTGAFPTLRFDVQIGRWRTKPVYGKVMYAEKRERLLTKSIHTYAKLKPLLDLYEQVEQDPEKGKRVNAKFAGEFPQNWLVQKEDGEQYLLDKIEQFSPHYNFGENVIGLRFVQSQKIVFPKVPDFRSPKPDALISTHELRNLFLYHYLSTSKKDREGKPYIETDTETFIKDFIARMQTFFEDVKTGALQPLTAPPDYRKNPALPFDQGDRKATEKKRAAYRAQQDQIKARRQQLDELLKERYGLSASWIPDDLKEYLLAYMTPSYTDLAKDKFKKQKALLKERLKDAEKGRSPRVGEQATWLAEDIVFLTPPQVHDAKGRPHEQKLNNDQFRILQSSLAYFSINRENIFHFLKNETPILSKSPSERHPFLFKINIQKCNGIFDFYLAYLKAKEEWLNEALEEYEQGRLNEVQLQEKYRHSLPSSVNRKAAVKRDYLSLPVFLPRGLFNQAIAEALSGKPGMEVKPEDNTVYCMAQLLDGDAQEFYEFPHFYRSIFEPKDAENRLVSEAAYTENLKAKFQELKQKKAMARKLSDAEKQQVKNDYKDVSQAKTRLLDREQHLRHLQANDRAMWLMIEGRQRFAEEHSELQFDQLKLRNIKSVLGEHVQAKLTIPDSSVTITDELPLRRYGDLRRIAKDRRLPNLARYYEAAGLAKISHELVKMELEKYDCRREVFFKELYQFEEEVYEFFKGDFDPDVLERRGFYNHREYVDVAVRHSTDTPFNLFFKEQVAELRNKFHHNEFPWFDWLSQEVANTPGELYANRVFDIAKKHYRKMRDIIRSGN